MDDGRDNPPDASGAYARGRRASFRSRAFDPRRESWGGMALGDDRRPVRRAALTFSLAASSCLLDAMVSTFPAQAAPKRRFAIRAAGHVSR
jgi:hypothetical protein